MRKPTTTPSRAMTDSAAWAEMLARTARANRRLHTALQHSMHSQAVAERVPKAVEQRPLIEELERERGRIARELHAGAGQPLAGIKLNLDLLEGWSQGMPTEAREALNRLHQLTEAALGQLRSVSHRLHPPEWQDLTTEAALRVLVVQTGIATQCETVVDIPALVVEPQHAVKVALYRCAQECISNVLRHSGATRFQLQLAMHGNWIELKISDNGKGFSPNTRRTGGIGIQSIREHTEALGGVAHVSSGADGTTITVCLPCHEDQT